MGTRGSLPPLNAWLERLLRENGISRAALARAIGRSRIEVQRWISGREQVPRVHLAEIASQVSDRSALDYALRLKDCEDLSDRLRRHLRDLARSTSLDSQILEHLVFANIDSRVSEEFAANLMDRASLQVYYLADAVFAFRLWAEAAMKDEHGAVITHDNIQRHLRYPVNHFVGLGLDLANLLPAPEEPAHDLAGFREVGLEGLWRLADSRSLFDSDGFIRQHALHLLARHGNGPDRDNVNDRVVHARAKADPLSRRLGFTGLILSRADRDLAAEYRGLLDCDLYLAKADMMFDAIHYGDVSIDESGNALVKDSALRQTVTNYLRHLEHPEQYGSMAELNCFRLIRIMDRRGPQAFTESHIVLRLHNLLMTQSFDDDEWTKEFRKRVTAIVRMADPEIPRVTPSSHEPVRERQAPMFDVFIAYNREDEEVVERIAEALRSLGLAPWFDKWHLPPGRVFQAQLESALPACRSVAVFVGPASVGPWERLEMRAAISMYVKRNVPVIPVLLSDIGVYPELPLFLAEFRWVKFSSDPTDHQAMNALVWGITGQHTMA